MSRNAGKRTLIKVLIVIVSVSGLSAKTSVGLFGGMNRICEKLSVAISGPLACYPAGSSVYVIVNSDVESHEVKDEN